MERRACLFILVFTLVLPAFSQDDWAWQNPLPQGNLLFHVAARDTQSMVALGASGTVLRTTDGGAHWSASHPAGSDSVWLGPLRFTDPDHGRMLKGTYTTQSFLLTADGGATWQEQDVDGWSGLDDFMFIDGSTGWAAGMGGNVITTRDAGETWYELPNPTSNTLVSVCFTDTSHGWVITSSDLYRTTNGGAVWAGWSPPLSAYFKQVTFRDNLRGWVFGSNLSDASGIVFRTTDGGLNWVDRSPALPTFQILSGYFPNSDTGWVTDAHGTILKTTDGGLTWVSVPSGTINPLQSIDFIDSKHGWAVGGLPDCIPCAGFQDGPATILRTTDGGTSWTPQMSIAGGETDVIIDIRFIGRDTGWATTGSGVLMTTDGGGLWKSILHADSVPVRGTQFSATSDWRILRSDSLYHSTNGGATWAVYPAGLVSANAMFFVNESTGWLAGEVSQIVKTTDGGASWMQQLGPGPDPYPIWTLWFTDSLRGWGGGGGGRLWRTTDGGVSWENQPHDLDYGGFTSLKSIFFIDPTRGWIAGPGIETTSDGGASWNKLSDTQGDDVFFTDSLNGWMTQYDGYVVHTSDGGLTWKRVHTGTTRDLGSVFFTDDRTGYFGGIYGTILKTTTGGGITSVGEGWAGSLPGSFNLPPNYPNPFNGSTVIRLELPGTMDVLMRIYDVLGREVGTLIDGRLAAGVRDVSWDASKFPSGVYYCVVRANGKMGTLKLLLVR